MSTISKPLLLTCLLLFTGCLLFSAYLSFQPQQVVQPDGNRLDLFASGDEYYNWLHDTEGFTIKANSNGWYVYLDRDSAGELIFTGLIAGRDNPARGNLTPGNNISPEQMMEYRTQAQRELETAGNDRSPTSGAINNIAIFVRFSDQTEFGQNVSNYTVMFNGTTGNTMQSYYLEASYNDANITTTMYPVSQSLVISWQDTDHPRSYYCPYSTTNPNGYVDENDRREREHTLFANAVNAVSSQIPASLNLDSDNDGRVDNVCFIIKGGTDAWSTLLWPHHRTLWTRTVNINGKRVYHYNVQLSDVLATSLASVLSHEMFHSMGAPDLYRYPNNHTYDPVGVWDIMGANARPPQHMGAYIKYKYGHWISDIPVLSQSGTYTLNPLTSPAGQCFRINSMNSTTEYFVVEFRKDTGTFEHSLPGSGMLIYRINEAATGNGDGPPDEVYVYRLNGTLAADGIINSATFSAETGRTSFSNTSNPNCFLADGTLANIAISLIGSSSGSDISFYYTQSSPIIRIVSGHIALTWSLVPNATGYNVYRSHDPVGNYQLIATTSQPSFTDPDSFSKTFYKIVALLP
jgi:M6 family metalloprotease-like protein